MTSLRLVVLMVAAAFAFTGCDTLSDATSSVREKIAARDKPRVRTFNAPPRETYDALRQAAAKMGYRYVRGGPAQGQFEGVSEVGAGEFSGSSRQTSVKVRLHATLDGTGTDASVRFTEILERDSSNRMGMATENTMKDTPLYEVLFRNIQQALDARPTAKPVQPATGSK
jgi:hypothetical protein